MDAILWGTRTPQVRLVVRRDPRFFPDVHKGAAVVLGRCVNHVHSGDGSPPPTSYSASAARKGLNMSEQLLDWFLLHARDPVPCDICRTLTAKAQLTERWVPTYVSDELRLVVDRAVWVCPTCPLP